MNVSLGSGDDGTATDPTGAIARRLGALQANQGYVPPDATSAASRLGALPANQGYVPPTQATAPSPGTNALDPGQQSAPSNAADALAQLAAFNRAQAAPSGSSPVGDFFSNVGTGVSNALHAIPGVGSFLAPNSAQEQQNATNFITPLGAAPELAIGQLGANAIEGGANALRGGVGDAASAIGRRLGLGSAGAADAARLDALRSAANVPQDAMRFGQPGNQGLSLADRIPGAAPYSSAELGPIAQPLSDVAARNAALDATRTTFPSEIPIQDVAAQNLGGIGGAIRRTLTNPNVYLGGGTAAGIAGAGALATSGTPNAAAPTGSTTPITDAYFASKNPSVNPPGGNVLEPGPVSGGGTVGSQPTPSQPTPSQPTIQQPTGGGATGSQPTSSSGNDYPFGHGIRNVPGGLGGATGSQPTSSSGNDYPFGHGIRNVPGGLGGATGSVTPIVESGSQSGTGTVPTSGVAIPSQGGPMNPSGQPSELNQITQQVSQDLTGLQSQIQNAKSPDVLNVFLQQGQSILDMLKSQEDQLRSDAQTKGTTIDPATQFTLDTMQKQLDTQLQGVRENLNRRGLLQSGIELSSENQVRAGNISAEGQLLSTRLSKIQQNLEAGLQSVNSQRVQTAQRFGMGGAQAQATADNNALNQRDALTRQLVNSRLALRGQVNTANENNLTRQNQSSIANAGFQNTAAIAAANRQSQQSIANANLQASGNRLNQTEQFTASQNALQQQASDARQAAALAAAAGNMAQKQAFDAQAAALQRQWQAAQDALYKTPASATPSPTATGSKLATDNFIVQLEGAPDQNSAMAAFNRAAQDGTFANAGADPVAILNAINQKQWGGGGFQLPFGIGQ